MRVTPRLTAIACALGLVLMAGAARAEVVVVVSAQSPVGALTRAELTDIYLGRTNRLPTGDPVVPIDQADRSPAYNEFYSKYLGQSTAQVKAHWSRLIFTGRGQPPRSVENSAAAAELVAGNPNAIAYVTADAVDDRLRIVTLE
jgi:ABC-type phosphate transport system substrate-binding protein